MIYAIQAGERGPIKIGVAFDVEKRRRALQIGHHEPLSVLAVIEGGFGVEKALHLHLHEYRIRGEWFEDNAVVRDTLRRAVAGEFAHAQSWRDGVYRARVDDNKTYREIAKETGYSIEYVRGAVREQHRQLTGCTLPSHVQSKEPSRMTGIDRVIEAAGGQTALAEVLAVSQQAVSKWQKRGYVPADRVDQLANAFSVERTELIDPRAIALIKGM